MTKKKLPVRFTGQHFTIDKVLIKDAIRQANISNQDTVLDIGAGKGFLTVHLLKIANNVVAIENDTALVEHLRKLFSDARNVQVVGCDFRNFAVPKFPFKVVSNIPYGITSDIFKILMFESLGNFLHILSNRSFQSRPVFLSIPCIPLASLPRNSSRLSRKKRSPRTAKIPPDSPLE